jgi:hypothetical protein
MKPNLTGKKAKKPTYTEKAKAGRKKLSTQDL